jgi:hypothetical protein
MTSQCPQGHQRLQRRDATAGDHHPNALELV